jgi:hypothetical protein
MKARIQHIQALMQTARYGYKTPSIYIPVRAATNRTQWGQHVIILHLLHALLERHIGGLIAIVIA